MTSATVIHPEQIPEVAVTKSRSPRRTIWLRCVYCAGSQQRARECFSHECNLWDYRPGAAKRRKAVSEAANGVDAGCTAINGTSSRGEPPIVGSRYLRPIRQHCLWCCYGSYKEVELCVEPNCPLYDLRFGVRPATVEKRRAARKER